MVCGTPYLMPLKFPPPISVHRFLPTTTSHPRLSSPLFPTCTLSVPEKSSYLPTPSLFDPTSIVNSLHLDSTSAPLCHSLLALSIILIDCRSLLRCYSPQPIWPRSSTRLRASPSLSSLQQPGRSRPALLPSSFAWQPPTHPCPPADIFLV
ncbi:hypothetical protein CMEL01_05447 [Colletotrichum melonis]|uniref:Uncharacterized protein n=1 Tax=Colletotrichum melonis TaxID=1209925 RepID=A0AAI9UAP6_9PEZI|nr:hypothetical protein CMEL01_05447 [Colletotrichum melonis]